MANPTTNFGWVMPTSTDLVTDLPADFAIFGQAVDTSMAELKGGTTGQVLSKTSNTDMDFTWVAQDDSNAIQNAIVDAKGDLIAATAADTPARLAVGTNGQVLTADSTAATGIKWAAPAGGGKVLQVVMGTINSETTTTSTSLVDTGLTATITPTLSTSKVLVFVSHNGVTPDTTSAQTVKLALLRGATEISKITDRHGWTNTSLFNNGSLAFNYLDTPATTSATTYKTQFARTAASGTVYVQNSAGANAAVSTIILMEIGA